MHTPQAQRAVWMLLLAGLTWGGFYHVAKAVLNVVDAFGMVLLRYAFTSLLFAAMLWRFEGLRAFRTGGEGPRLFLAGAIGFAAFNFLSFIGLSYSTAEHGAIIMALMPMITACVNWLRTGRRPSGRTLACIGLAFFGVLLVISKGEARNLLESRAAFGDLLLVGGACCWVAYTLMAGRYSDWSPLRFTTLTTLGGTVTVVLVVAGAAGLGATRLPSLEAVGSIGWHLAYIVLFASVAAVVAWNVGIRIVGPLNGILFINLLPVSAFAIGVAQGKQFTAIELGGAALVIVALVANNLLSRRVVLTSA